MPGFFEKTPSKLLIPAVGGVAALALTLVAVDAPTPAVSPDHPICIERSAPPPPPAPAPSPCAGGACAKPA